MVIIVREIVPTIKVMLMSAFEINSAELSEDLRGNKIQALIQKPIALDELGCYIGKVNILTSDIMLIS
jgi:hypothetical protein